MTANGLKVGFSVTANSRRARFLETLPIDSLWVGGHVASPNGVQEAMVALARLVELTERVTIGTSILLLPLYPPAIVAKQIADLDNACGGRIVLGVGVGGEYPEEFDVCQVPVTERGRRTDEAIPLLRKFWTGDPVHHDGRFYPVNGVRIYPAPVQGSALPIVVSGRSTAAMRRAARMGDGWMPYLYSARRYADSVAQVRAFAEETGRDLEAEGFEWTAFLFTAVADDDEAALDKAAGFLGGTYRQDFRQMVDRVAVAGSMPRVISRFQEFIDAGCRHLIITVCDREDPEGVARRLVEEAIPQLSVPAK